MKSPALLHSLVFATSSTLLTAAPIFDGETLSGWTGDTSGYVVEDGAIVCTPEGGNLYTEKEYSDFHLDLEFKLGPGSNNGIAIRTPKEGDPAYAGMEIQVLDDTAEKYAKLEKYQYHGSIYGVAAAERGHLKPVGEWNHQQITAIGDHIKIVLNGHTITDAHIGDGKTVDGKDHPGLRNDKGHIGFCGHGDFVAYRNISLDDLAISSSEGFKPLFNGENLDGWKSENRDAHWSAKDNEIHFDGNGKNLVTEKDYANFDLRLDYKIPANADSGIYVRGTPQIQIWDPTNTAQHPAGAAEGSGALWNNREAGNRPLVKADNPAGEWNTFFIRMVGDRVTVRLNDQLVVDDVPLEPYWEKDQPLPATGPIELQSHGSHLTFRNLQIRELP